MSRKTGNGKRETAGPVAQFSFFVFRFPFPDLA